MRSVTPMRITPSCARAGAVISPAPSTAAGSTANTLDFLVISASSLLLHHRIELLECARPPCRGDEQRKPAARLCRYARLVATPPRHCRADRSTGKTFTTIPQAQHRLARQHPARKVL